MIMNGSARAETSYLLVNALNIIFICSLLAFCIPYILPCFNIPRAVKSVERDKSGGGKRGRRSGKMGNNFASILRSLPSF